MREHQMKIEKIQSPQSKSLMTQRVRSVEYFKSADNYRLVPNICIASRGQVRTVLLLAKKPISEITSIAADIRAKEYMKPGYFLWL